MQRHVPLQSLSAVVPDWVRSLHRRHPAYSVVFLLASIVFPFAYLSQPLHIDEALFLTIGSAVAEGGQLYTEYLDHKPPGIFYLASLGHVFGTEAHLFFRLLTAFVTASTGLLVLVLGKTIADETVGMIGSLVFVVATYMPHFDGFVFLTEPYGTFCTAVAAVLFLRSRRLRSDVGAGFALGVGVFFNQIVFLFGAAIVAFALVRLWLPEHRQAAAFIGTARRILAIGVGFVAVVAPVLAYFAATGRLAPLVNYALVVPFTRYDPPFELGGHVVMTLSLFPVWLLVSGVVLRTLHRLYTRRVDESTLFVSLWFLFVSYPGLTQYVGDHKMLFTFPAAALLATVGLRLLWSDRSVRSRVASLSARLRGRPGADVSRRTALAAVVVVAMLVCTVGFNAAYAAAYRDPGIADQRAQADRLDGMIDGPVYMMPFQYHVAYFDDDVSVPEMYLGAIYSDELARGVVADLERRSVEHVVVRKWRIDGSGEVTEGGYYASKKEPVTDYVNSNYEVVGETEEYVVFRRQDTSS